MRAQGTLHTWPDAQQAWDHGRMAHWTQVKGERAMGFYQRTDLPFHYALADAFTVCDAYHCSFQGGTNTNRLFLMTGTNDGKGLGGGPSTYNDLDTLVPKPGVAAYTWTTYAERLQSAGVSWQVYQDMADNYDDNPLVGFENFRKAASSNDVQFSALKSRGLESRSLVQLRNDVLADDLPAVSWIVADAAGSEHPEPSSPAQGADYIARTLDALTANPKVWARTVLIINFDENDGFFDHAPPPAPPSIVDVRTAQFAGASTVDTSGEYHTRLQHYHNADTERVMMHRPYGLGMRVPMLLVSPWSQGGWVNSQVFDHTSIIQFIELRFGVREPNISSWRRAVCGDLSSAFDFAQTRGELQSYLSDLSNLPSTSQPAARAKALVGQPVANAPVQGSMPAQEPGIRHSRALPYQLHVHSQCHRTDIELQFVNHGTAGAVFHVMDLLNAGQMPRRYTVEAGRKISGTWSVDPVGHYDLWVHGPNGFHRHFKGKLSPEENGSPEIEVAYKPALGALQLTMRNHGTAACVFEIQPQHKLLGTARRIRVGPMANATAAASLDLQLQASWQWYDFQVGVTGLQHFSRRFAGRMETGSHSVSDPFL